MAAAGVGTSDDQYEFGGDDMEIDGEERRKKREEKKKIEYTDEEKD